MDRFQAMRVFVSVAELGSFTRAANTLGLSRARVSEAVAELERAGARVVHRETIRTSGSAKPSKVARVVVEWRREDG